MRRSRRDGGRPAALVAADTARPSQLLDRILSAPQLARAIPRLPPELLHRVIQHCGLEDCGELIAMATPEQLARVFDHDWWRPGGAGAVEQLDAERFGVWLEVMVQSDAATAAATVAAIDVDLMTTALAQHVRVFDYSAFAPYTTLDGHEASAAPFVDADQRFEVGGYIVLPKRDGPWDAIGALLVALDDGHHHYFAQLMRGCRRLSDSMPEIDGLDDLMSVDTQAVFDVADAREQRLGAQGYVSPAQARAFLEMARRIDLSSGTACPANAVAVECLRGVDSQSDVEQESGTADPPAGDLHDDVAAIVDVLIDAGVMPANTRSTPRLPPAEGHRDDLLQVCMQRALDIDGAAHATRTVELAFLANAILAGASLPSRPFTVDEASHAAAAVCALGLENWPDRWLQPGSMRGDLAEGRELVPDDFLVYHDLVGVFQVGWTILHEQVSMRAAECLIGVLPTLHGDDLTQSSLDALRMTLIKHWRAGTPWRARDELDVIAIFDLPSWAALLGLLSEIPVLPAAVGASVADGAREVSASAFEFIAENRQISLVREFLRLLPDRLR
jgi:hypothetical protein